MTIKREQLQPGALLEFSGGRHKGLRVKVLKVSATSVEVLPYGRRAAPSGVKRSKNRRSLALDHVLSLTSLVKEAKQ